MAARGPQMATDDRDSESSNPSNNFRVGDFDRLSGFFTPVWESKRKIRSEPPKPSSKSTSSSAAGRRGAPAPARGDEGNRAEVAPKPLTGAGDQPAATSAEPPSNGLAGAAVHGPSLLTSPEAVAAVFNSAAAQIGLEESALGRARGAAAVDADAGEASPPAQRARALIPLPEGVTPRPATPSPARVAFTGTSAHQQPQAFLDPDPATLRPKAAPARPRVERSPAQRERAQRASAAATRVHEQLKAKFQAEAAELAEGRYDFDPDTQRNLLDDAQFAPEPERYPLALLRQLRRTIRISAPVPEPIRALINKLDRS
jgi:hypothetical protein